MLALGQLPAPVEEPIFEQPLQYGPCSARLVGATIRAADGSMLLKDVSISVEPGERVGIIGPSGSGKTSVIYSLLHFLACSSGKAELAGNDVAQMSRRQIASLAGWVPDEAHVFAASLRNNLRVASPSASDAECAEALERAGLGEWARSLPSGLATRLGVGGQPLSAGERQRLGLARVLLAGSPVLLLDEPTSRLDQATSQAVLPELLDAAGGRSVLVVSHDPWIGDHIGSLVRLSGGSVTAGSGAGEHGLG